MRAKLLTTWLLLNWALLPEPALADTADGVASWQRGEYNAAVDQWRTAAAKGDAEAMFNLGQAYKMGRGVPTDISKAQDYYRQASGKGLTVAADAYGLALFQNGKPRDAVPYLEKAAGRGDARAQYLLGTMLFNGVDIRKDWVRAYALLTRSQRSGLPQANSVLAQMDQHIPAKDRRKGADQADRMAGPPSTQVAEVLGGNARGFNPGPSQVAGQPVTSSPNAPPPAPAAVAVASNPGGGWRLQLGAFGDAGNARRLGEQLAPRFPGHTIDYLAVGALTKVMVRGYTTRAAAQAACGSVKPCVPIGP